MSQDDPKLHRVEMTLCDLCLRGAGGECATLGCAFHDHGDPGSMLRNRRQVETVDGWPLCECCTLQRADRRVVTSGPGGVSSLRVCGACVEDALADAALVVTGGGRL